MARRTKEVNNEQRREKTKQIDSCSIPNKKKRIEQFTKNLVEDYYLDNCGCNKCLDWYKTLYELSSNIYEYWEIDSSDYERIENTKINIAICLISPSHLMYIYGEGKEGELVIDVAESGIEIFIKILHLTFDLMTDKEIKYFGKNVLAIQRLLFSPERKYRGNKELRQEDVELTYSKINYW